MRGVDYSELRRTAYHLRRDMLEMCAKAGTGHVTSSLSCVEILTALYYGGICRHNPSEPKWPERDRVFLSKGQASPILYVVLADLGYFPKSDLELFAQKGGKMGVHLQKSVPGVEITCGSLGQGFGIAAGTALAAKKNRDLFMSFAILGDGECYEGSVWETAMFAAHNRLNNLVAIVDRNCLCVTDFTESLVGLEPLEEKWAAFGWDVVRVDGHSFEALLDVLEGVRDRRAPRPLAIIADTVKGKGVDFMSNVPLWHGAAPSGDDVEAAREALSGMCEMCDNCVRRDLRNER